MSHPESQSILYKWQHGFRARHSTETQFIHELSENLDHRTQTDLIVLDFSKAFDKVSHKHLILKLKYYGINSTVIAWINSFLTSRTQSVTLEEFQSDHIAVTSGVPQGSVFGPILFLIYINDLPNEIKSSIRLFADDAIMYRQILSQTDCTALQNDIHTLEKWEQKWIMTYRDMK